MTTAPRRYRRRRPDWAPEWLAALAAMGTIRGACRVVNVGRSTVYDRRARDVDFAAAWDAVELEIRGPKPPPRIDLSRLSPRQLEQLKRELAKHERDVARVRSQFGAPARDRTLRTEFHPVRPGF